MPYITPGARLGFDVPDNPHSSGDLNYIITRTLVNFFESQGGLSYDSINAAIGALECAKLELYRRLAGPYEEAAMLKNGDVYPHDLLRKTETLDQSKPRTVEGTPEKV